MAIHRLLLISIFLLVLPAVHAHTDGGVWGTPKNYCENLKGDQNVHDYAVNGATGVFFLIAFFRDGNIEDCDGDGVPYDHDGHSEWASGGAWLLSSDAGAPFKGANACHGEDPHHETFPYVFASDTASFTVRFIVGVDNINTVGADPATGLDCGDGVDDDMTALCVDVCQANLLPGLDGAYHVYVVNHVPRQDLTECDPNVYVDLQPIDICLLYQQPPLPAATFAAAGHVFTWFVT